MFGVIDFVKVHYLINGNPDNDKFAGYSEIF